MSPTSATPATPRVARAPAAIAAAIAALLVAGVAWRVQQERLNLTTSLLLLLAVFATLLALVEAGLALFGISQRMRGNLRALLVASAAVFLCSELFLRYGLDKHTTYLEKNEGRQYRPLYERRSSSWFHVYSKNLEFTHSRPEFAFPRKTNSLGLCEREFPEQKPPGEYRVIALGDSYTEGVGTPYEETWLKTVEKRLQERAAPRNVQAFNAGISGSDPWHEYMLLKEKLLRHRPDLVLVAINTSDIPDVMMRGGRERFQPDGTTLFSRRPPAWEWLYASSYLFRHVVHDLLKYDYLFIRESEREAEENKAIDHIVAAVGEFAALGREHGYELIVVLHPDSWEAHNEKHGSAFGRLAARLKQAPELRVVDVLSIWKSNGVLKREGGASQLYWAIDGHNNPKGYAAFGEAVATGIAGLQSNGR